MTRYIGILWHLQSVGTWVELLKVMVKVEEQDALRL